MAVGILLVGLSLLLYFYRDYLFIPGFVGVLFCVQALVSWYGSPRSLTLENNSLTVHYLNRSISLSADDIAAIQIRKTERDQFRSVALILRDQSILDISGFEPTPFITYPVLTLWHQKHAASRPIP
jgi:hypothetical protein